MRKTVFSSNAFPPSERREGGKESFSAKQWKFAPRSKNIWRKIVAHFNQLSVENFFSMSLKDKICIVTGAAVGLGRAFCEQLLKQGAFVRKKSFGLIESEKEFNNRLRLFFRFLSLILTPMPANFVAWSYSSNSARIGQYFATVMSQTIRSSKVWRREKSISDWSPSSPPSKCFYFRVVSSHKRYIWTNRYFD